MLLRIPGLTDGGLVSHALVEHVDIMATLIEAAGLPPVPVCPVAKPWKTALCTEGTSMMPLIKNPTRAWTNASYSQYPRKGSPPKIMGYSMRLVEVRFTAWVDFDGIRNETAWTMDQKDCGFELYNLTADPLENHNLAYHDGMQQKVKMHFEQLKAGWRATASALPTRGETEKPKLFLS